MRKLPLECMTELTVIKIVLRELDSNILKAPSLNRASPSIENSLMYINATWQFPAPCSPIFIHLTIFDRLCKCLKR